MSSRPRASFVQSPRPQARGFVPGRIENWQAQHPPLYYYLLAPVYLASKTLSLAGQLFVLRASSYLVAWMGLCIVAVAAWRGMIPQRAATADAVCDLRLAARCFRCGFPRWGGSATTA